MAVPARQLPKRVRALTEWPNGDNSYPAGYAVASDGRIVRLDNRTVNYLTTSTGRRPRIGARARGLVTAAKRWGLHAWPLVLGLAGLAGSIWMVFWIVDGVKRSPTSPFPALLTAFAPLVLVAVFYVGVRELFGPRPPDPSSPDATKIDRLSNRPWVVAPPLNTQERGLAAAAARLHDRITVSPIWEHIVVSQGGPPIDLDGEVMDILGRLRDIGQLREELGTPAGRTDPVKGQHKALDQSVLSVALRIDALAGYADQLVKLKEETAELERLERAELLHDRVLDLVAEQTADPSRSIDPADLGYRISSTRAAIAAAKKALEASAAALSMSKPIDDRPSQPNP